MTQLQNLNCFEGYGMTETMVIVLLYITSVVGAYTAGYVYGFNRMLHKTKLEIKHLHKKEKS